MTITAQSGFFTFLVLFSILSSVPPSLQDDDIAIENAEEDIMAKMDLIELARLAEEVGRYGSMAKAMQEAAKICIDSNQQLNFDERELLQYSYKIIIEARRKGADIIYDRLDDGKHHSETYLKILRKMKTDIIKEAVIICNDVIELAEKLLKNKQLSKESQIFYMVWKADYMRYISDTQNNKAALETSNLAKEIYEEALTIAQEFSPKSVQKLTLVTKMTTLLCDNLRLYEEAYNLAKETVEAAEKEVERINNIQGDKSNKDVVTADELTNINHLKINVDKFKEDWERSLRASKKP